MVFYMGTPILNVSDYLTWIKAHKCTEGNIPFEQSNMYYRGHASCSWSLTPNLFRKQCFHEYEAIRLATRRLWNKLSQLSYLERIIFFQHYGLKTRLLDVTYNPLIALYFACQEVTSQKDSRNGEIFYGYCNDDGTLLYADIFAEIVSTHDFFVSNCMKKQVLLNIANKYNLESNVLEEVLCNPIFIYPPYNSDRIIAQQGAFVMAPIFKPDNDKFLYRTDYTFKRDRDSSYFANESIIIPSECKTDILEELETLNINDATVFPEIENQIKAINKKLEPKYKIDL